MAGPGGGPPRRSHTKSRKGCEACKRRHIRCDESFPQCRNCTKHKIRCPYNDVTLPDDRSTPEKPDLMWTPEIEAVIVQWRRTGVFPFPSLDIYPTPAPESLSFEDLRLLHHVAAICDQMASIDANGFTLWTRHIPTIIKIGATHRYVLDALLAFSAMHIAFLTNCPVVGNMGYEHRGNALKGLHTALDTFTKETSDAVLAASLVLSWQATDWRSWTQHMHGTSAVIDAMDRLKHESLFGDFIAESCTFPTAPASPAPDHKPVQPRKEDINALNQALAQLQKVESYLKSLKEDTKSVSKLINFLKGSKKVSATMSVETQFELLRPLRAWLFWMPVMFLQQTHGSPKALVVIAYYYVAALLMERLFPEIGAAYFGSLTIGPVEEIARRLYSHSLSGTMEGDMQTPLDLMAYPTELVTEFRSRMGWSQPVRTPSFPQFHPSPFELGQASPQSATTPEFVPYGENPAFSYSTDNLSVITTDSGHNTAITPLQLSSPYANPQYLSIPSPSYCGAYSPTSSTFNDFGEASSIAYSDNEDYAHFEMGLSPSTPIFGGGNFGLGFVTPIQTPAVWI